MDSSDVHSHGKHLTDRASKVTICTLLTLCAILAGCGGRGINERRAVEIATAHASAQYRDLRLTVAQAQPLDVGKGWVITYPLRSVRTHGGAITVIVRKTNGEVLFTFDNAPQ